MTDAREMQEKCMIKFNKDAAIAMLAKTSDDEPVFVLRAQDKASVPAIRAWIMAAIEVGARPDKTIGAEDHARAFEAWQRANPSKVKVPD